MKPSLSFSHFTRKLSLPFRYGKSTLSERSGLYLKLESHSEVLFSEVSPLPGISNENILSIQKTLEAHSKEILETIVNPLAKFDPCSPSLRWAISCMKAQLIPKHGFGDRTVASNGVISLESTTEKFLEKWRALLSKGYTTFKIKINDENYMHLLSVIEKQLEVNCDIRIRLDANQSLSEQSWSKLCERVQNSQLLAKALGYVEEPTQDFFLNEKKCISPLKVAVDESLKLENLAFLLSDFSPAEVFILKPSQWGSHEEVLHSIELIRDAGKEITITSAFETELGRLQLIDFISRIPSYKAASGLSVGGFFADNLLADRPNFILPLEMPAEFTEIVGDRSWISLA